MRLLILRAKIFSPLIMLALSIAAWANFAGASEDPWARAPVIVRAANSWRAGEPIPPELRHFQKSPSDLPDAMDSEALISQVTNLPLLASIATDTSADPECREDAFAQGMYAGGPTMFFAIVERDLGTKRSRHDPWLTDIRDRISQPHVVVDALDIRDADMPLDQANQVLDRITHDLRRGDAWASVYERYSGEFGYHTGHTTKVGNLGHFVLFPDPSLGHGHYVEIGDHTITWEGEELPRRLSRLGFFDASHLGAIINAPVVGDVIRLHSATYHEHVLYQVQEVYPTSYRGN